MVWTITWKPHSLLCQMDSRVAVASTENSIFDKLEKERILDWRNIVLKVHSTADGWVRGHLYGLGISISQWLLTLASFTCLEEIVLVQIEFQPVHVADKFSPSTTKFMVKSTLYLCFGWLSEELYSVKGKIRFVESAVPSLIINCWPPVSTFLE